MSKQYDAYQRYLDSLPKQDKPLCLRYYDEVNAIMSLSMTEIADRNIMDYGVSHGAYVLLDGRAIEVRQEYQTTHVYVFSSVSAYQSYVKPMSLNQYHEF